MQEIVSFYRDNPDEDRLSRGWGALEFARSKEILLRHLGEGRRTILDVGGGTGVYSEWLGEMGHETHLVDITPSHVEFARAKRTLIASTAVGDARRLEWPDASVDAVLELGPLYHLVDAGDRALALEEARRVLRPGGIAFVAAICRFAPLLASLVDGFFDDLAFHEALLRDLKDGQHRNPTGDPRRFTTAYFHRPEALVAEMRGAGFGGIECLAVEGPCWVACGSEAKFDECWSNAGRRERLLQLARIVERDPMALASSPHILGIGRV